MFALYANTAGTAIPVDSCPLANGLGCANRREESLQNSDHETVFVVKIDHTINAANTVWYRFQSDTGLQAAYTDPINVHLQLLLSAAAVHACQRLHAHLPSQSR